MGGGNGTLSLWEILMNVLYHVSDTQWMHCITQSSQHPAGQLAWGWAATTKHSAQGLDLSHWPWRDDLRLPWLNPRWLKLEHRKIYLSQQLCTTLVGSRKIPLSYREPGELELKSTILFLSSKTNYPLSLLAISVSSFCDFLTWEEEVFILGTPAWVVPFSFVDIKQTPTHYSENLHKASQKSVLHILVLSEALTGPPG